MVQLREVQREREEGEEEELLPGESLDCEGRGFTVCASMSSHVGAVKNVGRRRERERERERERGRGERDRERERDRTRQNETETE